MITAVIERPALYELSSLPYAYNALEPYISGELLTVHHIKRHQAYVDAANALEDMKYSAGSACTEIDLGPTNKALSFNVSGIVLHDFYWLSLAPAGKTGKPHGAFDAAINREYGNLEKFKEEFTRVAMSLEGGGWVVLAMCDLTRQPSVMKIEKNLLNLQPTFAAVMMIDLWEHAYYIDYKNNRAAYLESIWNIINWNSVCKRWDNMMKWISG